MRYTNLQALRTIGALVVVLCHLRYHAAAKMGLRSPMLDWIFDYLTGPVIAVFFAMSGYVLVLSLERTSASKFILRRLLRIFPAFWVAIGISILLTLAQGVPFPFDFRLVTSMLLVPVGRERAFYPLTVEWTLVFELFFYAALGAMMLVSRRRGPTIGAACWLAVVIGAMIVRKPGPYEVLPNWTEITLSPYTTPFLLGALAARMQRFNSTIRLVAPIVVPTLILIARLTPRWDVSTLIMGSAGAWIVAWAAAAKQMSAANPIAVFGDWSYGLYLLHVPIISTFIHFALKQHWAHPSLDLVWLACLMSLGGGLLFGRCEAAVYQRLRKLLITRPTMPAEPPITSIETARMARAA